MDVSELPYAVKMILKQGNLDHWFNADLWGSRGANIRPAPAAFAKAVECGYLERKGGRYERFRLTDAGRVARRELERLGGSPAGYEIFDDASAE
jgi:hypothetical protein